MQRLHTETFKALVVDSFLEFLYTEGNQFLQSSAPLLLDNRFNLDVQTNDNDQELIKNPRLKFRNVSHHSHIEIVPVSLTSDTSQFDDELEQEENVQEQYYSGDGSHRSPDSTTTREHRTHMFHIASSTHEILPALTPQACNTPNEPVPPSRPKNNSPAERSNSHENSLGSSVDDEHHPTIKDDVPLAIFRQERDPMQISPPPPPIPIAPRDRVFQCHDNATSVVNQEEDVEDDVSRYQTLVCEGIFEADDYTPTDSNYEPSPYADVRSVSHVPDILLGAYDDSGAVAYPIDNENMVESLNKAASSKVLPQVGQVPVTDEEVEECNNLVNRARLHLQANYSTYVTQDIHCENNHEDNHPPDVWVPNYLTNKYLPDEADIVETLKRLSTILKSLTISDLNIICMSDFESLIIPQVFGLNPRFSYNVRQSIYQSTPHVPQPTGNNEDFIFVNTIIAYVKLKSISYNTPLWNFVQFINPDSQFESVRQTSIHQDITIDIQWIVKDALVFPISRIFQMISELIIRHPIFNAANEKHRFIYEVTAALVHAELFPTTGFNDVCSFHELLTSGILNQFPIFNQPSQEEEIRLCHRMLESINGISKVYNRMLARGFNSKDNSDVYIARRALCQYRGSSIPTEVWNLLVSVCPVFARSYGYSLKDIAMFMVLDMNKVCVVSLSFWFTLLDIDGDGVITEDDLDNFYAWQSKSLISRGMGYPQKEGIYSEIMDRLNIHESKLRIELDDFIRNPYEASNIINMMANTNNYILGDCNDESLSLCSHEGVPTPDLWANGIRRILMDTSME